MAKDAKRDPSNPILMPIDQHRPDVMIVESSPNLFGHGEPVSIAVKKFRVMKESHERPSVKEMRGILTS